MMKKIDLYKLLAMAGFVDGDSFEYEIEEGKSSVEQISLILDEICRREQLVQLNGEWNRITIEEGSKLLINAFHFDLAHNSIEAMDADRAENYCKQVLSRLDLDNCLCFTNWFKNPWETTISVSWNPITTQSTLDMAVVFVDNEKVVFTYFISEP